MTAGNEKSKREARLAYWKAYNAKRKDALRAWALANKDRLKSIHKAWCQRNKEKRRAASRRCYWKHREDRVRRSREYAKLNKARLSVNSKLYHAKNRERRNAYNRKYYQARYPLVRERLIAQTSAYAKAHPEIRCKCAANYHKAHPHVRKALCSQRRALRKKASTAPITTMRQFYKQLSEASSYNCAYCSKHLSKEAITLDHIIPLTRGGMHHPSNFAIACRSCNSSKGKRTLEEWHGNRKSTVGL